jgi:hypothetical protein
MPSDEDLVESRGKSAAQRRSGGRILIRMRERKGQAPEDDVWRRLERAYVAGDLVDGAFYTVGEVTRLARAGGQDMMTLQMRLAEHRSPLLLVEEGKGYRVRNRFVAVLSRPSDWSDGSDWSDRSDGWCKG